MTPSCPPVITRRPSNVKTAPRTVAGCGKGGCCRLAGGDLPYARRAWDRVIALPGCRHQPQTVPAEGDGVDHVGLGHRWPELRPFFNVPDPNGFVVGPRSDQPAVRAIGER